MPQVLFIPIPAIIIPVGIAVVSMIVFFIIRRKVRKKTFARKSIMMFGPPLSGKTTFLNMLTRKEVTTEHSSADEGYTEYFDEDSQSRYRIYDIGGAPEFLIGGKGERLYMDNDFILMFFDASRYLPEESNSKVLINNYTSNYIIDINSRFEALATWYKKNEKPIVIIGSHRDKMTEDQQKKFSNNLANGMDKSKEYYQFVCSQKFVLANLTDKSDVGMILKVIYNLNKEKNE